MSKASLEGSDAVTERGRVLARGLGLSRRQAIGASIGVAAAGTVGVAVTAAPSLAAANAVLVPPPRRGIILYTVRDAISRDPGTTTQASGFREVFQYLADVGYRQVEFAGYNQHANAPGGNVNSVAGARRLRRWLDNYGLAAQGNHGSVPSEITAESLAAFDTACEMANELGMDHIGTGGDPVRSDLKADWDRAADRWNILGERARRTFGLKLYTHNHDDAYGFLLDSADDTGAFTRSTGVRKLEYFLTMTDPKNVYLEMDIYWAHVAQFRFTDYTAADGQPARQIFDPARLVAANTARYPLFHAKDGSAAPTAEDGYSIVPFGTGAIDYQGFFRTVDAKNRHHPMVEQDNAASIGDGSLANARIGYENLAALRG